MGFDWKRNITGFFMNIMRREIEKAWRGWAPQIIGWIAIAMLSGGCVTSGQTPDASINLIMAENSQMKKRLPLIERENDVLEQENLQYKARVRKLAATIEKLRADLATLNEKYARDIALSEERFQNLQDRYEKLEAESDQAIATLTASYEALQEKRNREQKDFNEKIALQQTSFNQERDELKQNYATQELSLQSEISKLKSALGTRDEEVKVLNTTNLEISQKLSEVKAQLAEAQRNLKSALMSKQPDEGTPTQPAE